MNPQTLGDLGFTQVTMGGKLSHQQTVWTVIFVAILIQQL